MGFIDKMLDKMKLGAYEDDPDDELYDEIDDEPVKPKKSASAPVSKPAPHAPVRDEYEPRRQEPARPVKQPSKPIMKQPARPANSGRVVNMQGRRDSMEVCVIKPVKMEDSREIVDTLLSGKAVVLNLEGIDVDLAQRISDFTSGACYAVDGNLKKITNYIFIATPTSIAISGDLLELISNNGFNGDSVNIGVDTTF